MKDIVDLSEAESAENGMSSRETGEEINELSLNEAVEGLQKSKSQRINTWVEARAGLNVAQTGCN